MAGKGKNCPVWGWETTTTHKRKTHQFAGCGTNIGRSVLVEKRNLCEGGKKGKNFQRLKIN